MTPDGIALRHPDLLFIGGKWVAANSSRMIEIVSPGSEAVLGTVAEADERDMDRAVEAARLAFDHGPCPRTAPRERGVFIARMAEMLKTREPELARAWTAQFGGLGSFAPMMMAVATMVFTGIMRWRTVSHSKDERKAGWSIPRLSRASRSALSPRSRLGTRPM